MEEKIPLNDGENDEIREQTAYLKGCFPLPGDVEAIDLIAGCVLKALSAAVIKRDVFNIHPLVLSLSTAHILIEEIGLGRDVAFAVLIYPLVRNNVPGRERLEECCGGSVLKIVRGLLRTDELYSKSSVVTSENFRDLLLSSAEDMRVVLIFLAERVAVMRRLRDTEAVLERRQTSLEAAALYAPIAHKLGLYRLKSELEDLSLKYLEHDTYYMIRDNLASTKAARDAYIASFIAPVKAELERFGLVFHIKGRTKSIHSIWQKMKKQQCGFNGIYDLFAIRIILASAPEREKADCWQVFSIITNMYQSNPKRMRDWLSRPKSNGYESLHITVLGPESKWVEVQIRSERMDEIAERGVAAHWRYKGIKGEGGLDAWLGGVRVALETGEDIERAERLSGSDYDKDVYVFSPKGDLYKLAAGATVLDFAFYIHSEIGSKCVGAKINGRIVSIRESLHSGDQVEILTQSNQTPKSDWLEIVRTARGKAKLRLALKENLMKETALAKELVERRLRNRKYDLDEATLSHVVNKLGYKAASDFFMDIARGRLEVNAIIEKYIETRRHDLGQDTPAAAQSAAEYSFDASLAGNGPSESGDVLVIDESLKGVDYTLAKCCNPIYGDDVFGFVTVTGGIKIHRSDCPNAPELRSRFGYRIVRAQWSGKGQAQYAITIRVVGNDDIGIINNITSIISKEERTVIRSINVDSDDGLFSGVIVLMVEDTLKLNRLMKKIETVKGVRLVERV
ncbi:MAG: HD domain-containing protein [Prevotella sp.]|nr:HD domain-containing protein [Prevotella sp.]